MEVSTEHKRSHFYILITIVLVIAILEICGQTCIREFRKNGSFQYIVFGALLYMVVVVLLFHSYKYHGMGMVNLLWSCLSIILAIAVGYFIFEEKVNKNTGIAVVLAICAVYFANRGAE